MKKAGVSGLTVLMRKDKDKGCIWKQLCNLKIWQFESETL